MTSLLCRRLPVGKSSLALTMVFALAACDTLGINSVEEFRNNVIGKQYTSTEVADTIIVDGTAYVVNRRDFKDLSAGAEQETGTDYTVIVAGSVLSCDAAMGLAACFAKFRSDIPARLETQRAAERSEDSY